MRLSTLITAAALAFLPFAVSAQDHPEGIHVHDAYARIGPKSGAVFFTLHNNTQADVQLIGAHSDVAKKAELHTHTQSADGVMKMTKIEGGIAIAAGEMHEFARGGDHVMLKGLTRPLAEGDTFDLVLDFADGSTVDVQVTVDSKRAPDAGGMAGMKHGMKHGTDADPAATDPAASN